MISKYHRYLIFTVLTAFSNALMASDASKKPNIIFLMTDDQAYWAVGYDNPEFLTPEIDKLANDGVVFNKHYNTTAICMASRANVMTGMLEYKTGSNFSRGDMTTAIFDKSYPVLLRNAGYFTGFVGKFGFDTPPSQSEDLPKGYKKMPVDKFDFWAGGIGQTSFKTSANYYMKKYAKQYPHVSLANGAATVDFIRQAKAAGKPFQISVSFKAPHAPVDPDPKFDTLFKDRKYSKPANYWRENGTHLALQSKLGRQYMTKNGFGFEPKTYNKRMLDYNQQIYGVDVAISMIRKELAAQGIADNTVIIFTSDNGFQNGSHGFSRKVLPYEESVRTPMIVFDPRAGKTAKGQRTNAVTGNIDIAPTILDIAGLAIPDNIDGKSLVAVTKNPSLSVHQSLPLINVWGSAPTHALGVVTDRWKYVYWFYADGMEPVEELFDLSIDSIEMKNVATDPANIAVLKAMREHYDNSLRKWQQESVSSNGYDSYATLFDRHIPWDKKKKSLESKWFKTTQGYIKKYKQDPKKFFDIYGFSLESL
ncbi:MAG: sulfatase-like hydrolase/transferase [Thalassotalea sp.]